ncbi:type I secretion system permease/ATPase (plasmid) [Ensifer adhaerens]|uniref:type I secretion system permease/ATPase n=1 Tax=Ensifer adhaerens TaxID=106592 RepID=UPI0023A9A497|nr:type I secretion system permease/ATPase [Ensifer adhaerens]WDZ79716.1 type I secretion system permease/ATPase [Ensifer adhaerens]
MTDRTDPSRQDVTEVGNAPSTDADETPRQAGWSDAQAAQQRFIRRLDRQEDILDRAVKEIDGVADQLRRAVANGASEIENSANPGAASAPSPSPKAASPTPATDTTPPPANIASRPINPVPTTTNAAPPAASATQTEHVVQRAWPPRIESPAKVESLSALRDRMSAEQRSAQEQRKSEPRVEKPVIWPTAEMKDRSSPPGMVVIDGDRGPIKAEPRPSGKDGGSSNGNGGGGGGGGGGPNVFHKRLGAVDFTASLKAGLKAIRQNLMIVMVFTIATNVLVLAIPVYLFQISDRVLTSRSIDTLVMLTALIVGAVVLQTIFDGIRRMILMRTAVEVAAQLGAPILSAAARAALHSNGREYQTLGDLQQLRAFLVSGTLLSFLDAPIAPFFVLAVFLIHPHLGAIVITSAFLLLIVTLLNQRATAGGFGEATNYQTKANLHLDSMSRNSQIINALAMIPEAVHIWGKDMAGSLKAQVLAQDRNIAFASLSKAVRLLTQVTMLGWGANLALHGHLTGGMVISASIIAGRALGPIEAAIEGWHQVIQARAAYGRISALLHTSPLNFERLKLPRPEGRLDVERLLFVPQGTKRVVLNGITFSLEPGDSLAVIGSSGAGKTTLGKMLVGSILPTSGNVRLDLMDLRNWDQRQFGESIGYLPQDVQLFPGTIKANIARMREDATDAEIYAAAKLADVHDMIAMLPHGYETVVAADGSPLSGGQKQRVALARAFFGNPRMVVLDEPNSNLDTSGETALTRALTHAKREKITVITITQRPALLNSVDKVLLLVNGTVALFGHRQDVLKALASRGVNTEGNPLDQPQLP